MGVLELLANLGLPSAFVGIVATAWLFRNTHAKASGWALALGLVFFCSFGVIQLVDYVRNRGITVEVKPDDAYAIDENGPVRLDIVVTKSDKTLVTKTLEEIPSDRFHSRLRDLGWTPGEENLVAERRTAQFWSTNRIHAGQVQRLGATEFGVLRIRAVQFTANGKAVVTLELAGHQDPLPNEVTIENKSLDVQSFVGIPEFYVAVREADFQTDLPWAAFNVFTVH